MERIHLIGVGRTGLSAIARVLLEKGYAVSGSDQHYSDLAKSVEKAGVKFFLGHHPDNINGADIVIRSSAIPDDNIEVIAARLKGIPVYKRSDYLNELMAEQSVIAVAGTHGKTTTSAMIAWITSALRENPSFIIGGVVSNLKTNARYGKGQYFIIEADEYDRMFLGLDPHIAVITNIEHDHPDCFPSFDDYTQAFKEFVGHLTSGSSLIICGDDPNSAEMIRIAKDNGCSTFTYGINNFEYNYKATRCKPDQKRGGYTFSIEGMAFQPQVVSLKVPGLHNVRNAVAAFAVADTLGLDHYDVAQALSSYKGTNRRFEYIGEKGGITVISDYAHHPTEISATLSATKSNFPDRRIIAVWQPHTYSRTQLLSEQFTEAFTDADLVLVTEVYPAREPINEAYSSKQLVDVMVHPNVHFVPKLLDVVNYLKINLRPNDVLIVLSAGDADQICSWILSEIN